MSQTDLEAIVSDPEFASFSAEERAKIVRDAQKSPRKPLVTADAIDPAPAAPKRARSVVEKRNEQNDPLAPLKPKVNPVPPALRGKTKGQQDIEALAEQKAARRIGTSGRIPTPETVGEAALEGAREAGNMTIDAIRLGAEAVAAPTRKALDDHDERQRPAIAKAADKSPAARFIPKGMRPTKSASEQIVEGVEAIKEPFASTAHDLKTEPSRLAPWSAGAGEGAGAYAGAMAYGLADPVGDALLAAPIAGAAVAGKAIAGRLAKRAANAARKGAPTPLETLPAPRELAASDLESLVARAEAGDLAAAREVDAFAEGLNWQAVALKKGEGWAGRDHKEAFATADAMQERSAYLLDRINKKNIQRPDPGTPKTGANRSSFGELSTRVDKTPTDLSPPDTLDGYPSRPTPAPDQAAGSLLADLQAVHAAARDAADDAMVRMPADDPEYLRLREVEEVARQAVLRAAEENYRGKFTTPKAPESAAPAIAAATPARPAALQPWQVRRAEFEATGEDLLHGTSRQFDRFDGSATDRYGQPRNHARRFYFTDKPEVADTFAASTGHKQVGLHQFADVNDLDADEAMPQLLESLRRQVARGKRLMAVDENGNLVEMIPDDPRLSEALLDEADVRLYNVGAAPRVIKTKVYGKTLDLSDPKQVPADLRQELAAEGRYKPWEDGLPDFNHEYSRVLYDYARRHGYGKIRVRDVSESGFKSTIGLEEFIGHGRDPHREMVEAALKRGDAVPAEVLADYPDLAPQASQGGGGHLSRLASSEDGAFRPERIGAALRSMFGRGRDPIPAPASALSAPPVTVDAPAPPSATTINGMPASRAAIPLEDIFLDPRTYQFKDADLATGRNARFSDDETWNPDFLEQKALIVHRRDGRYYVADGHQRVNLARVRRAAGDTVPPLKAIVLDEADGWTPGLVKIKASLVNIGEGTGSAIDVARLIRDAGMTPEQMGISPKSAAVRDGRILAALNDEAIAFIANNDLPAAIAAEAAKATDDPQMQMVILREIAEDKPAYPSEAALLARDVIESGLSAARPANQLAMFDLAQYSKSNRKTLYRIVNELSRALKGDESMARFLTARGERIKQIEGNALNDEANAALKTEAGTLQYVLQREAGAVGEFREALKVLAQEVDSGKRTVADAVAQARRVLEHTTARPDAGAGAGGPGPVQPAAGAPAPALEQPAALPAVDLFGNPTAPEPVAPAAPPTQEGPGLFGDVSQFVPTPVEPPTPVPVVPVPSPEALAQVPIDPLARTALATQPSEAVAQQLDDLYRMRDRFVRTGNLRGVADFQGRIDALEAPFKAPAPPPAATTRQIQGRLNMLKRQLREARMANNAERAGFLSSQVYELEGVIRRSKMTDEERAAADAVRQGGAPMEDRSPTARAHEREHLTTAAYTPEAEDAAEAMYKARQADTGIHKRMHNLPGDPDNIAASVFENFRIHGGSAEEAEILADAVRRTMARADWNPHARVPVKDVLEEAAAVDPALVDDLIRNGIAKDQLIPMQLQAAIRQRQDDIRRTLVILKDAERDAIVRQDVAEAREVAGQILALEKDLDAALEITVPMGSKYARALRMEAVASRAEGFDPTFWLARARRNASGDTQRPAPPRIEAAIKNATVKGEAAQTKAQTALERLRALGVDTSALENPRVDTEAIVRERMKESGLQRFMGRLKEWGITSEKGARPGAIAFGRSKSNKPSAPPPIPRVPESELAKFSPEQRAEIEALWNEAGSGLNEAKAAKRELVQATTDARVTPFFEAVTNTGRAFLIAGVKTLERNFVSNSGNIAMEGAAKVAGIPVDALMSRLGLTKDPGQRTARLRRLDHLAEDLAAAVKDGVVTGGKEWWQTLTTGAPSEELAKLDVLKEQNTEPYLGAVGTAWDGVNNLIFRNQTGADRPNYRFTYTRSLQRQAADAFPEDRPAQKAFVANPPEDAITEAHADAAWVTFQNDTKMNDVLQGIGRVLRSGGRGGQTLAFLYDNQIPFKKTPSAVVTRAAVDYNPLGAAGRMGGQVAESISKRDLVGKWEGLDRNAQRQISMAFGRGAVGAGLMWYGWHLADKGEMTGYYRPELKEEFEATGRVPGAMLVGGYWLPLQWLGPLGHLLAVGATLHEAGIGRETPVLSGSTLWEGTAAHAQSLIDSPMMTGAKQVQEVLAAPGDEKSGAQKLNRIVGNLTSRVVPSVVNEASRFLDADDEGFGRKREVTDDTMGGAIAEGIQARTPWRASLPAAVDVLGREVREPGGINAFNAAAGRPAREVEKDATGAYKDQVARAILESGAELRPAWRSFRDTGGRGKADDVSIRLNPEQERRYRVVHGQAVYDEVTKVIPAYLAARETGDRQAMRDIVQAAIDKGSKAGNKAYRAEDGEAIKAGRPAAEAEKAKKLRLRAVPVAGEEPWWATPGATVPPGARRGPVASPTP